MNCNKIITDKYCNTIVTDESFSSYYIYVYILQLNKTDGTTQSQVFIKDNPDDEIKFTIGKDGFYTLCRLKILRNDLSKEQFPDFMSLEEKFSEMSDDEKQEFINNGVVFYKNGIYFYKKPKMSLDNIKEVTIQELVQINHKLTNIDITYYYYFQICKLKNCFAKIAKSILDRRSGLKCESKISSEDIYKRDLIWSALNTILYMAEQEQFEEASELLERIVGCNGLCEGEDYSNCGCNK